MTHSAAVSEDTWFDDEKIAHEIADRIGGHQHYSFSTIVRDARSLLDYLARHLDNPFPTPNAYLQGNEWQDLINIEMTGKVVESLERELRDNPWSTADERYYRGKVVKGVIIRLNEYGLFVRLEPQLVGLVATKNILDAIK